MTRPISRTRLVLALTAVLALALTAVAPASARPNSGPLGRFKHLVVIYEENHSFDNLYGLWGSVNGQHVVGLSDADAAHTLQVAQDGSTYSCLLQTDLNLRTVNQSPAGPLSRTCGPEIVTR